MLEMLRNMARRRSRTSLTVVGIVIGIFALAVMGSLAEKMNLMIDGGVKYYTGQLTIAPKGGEMSFGSALNSSIVEEMSKVPGVRRVSPYVALMLDEEAGMSFGMPSMITGLDPAIGLDNRNYKKFDLDTGRMLRKGDVSATVVGWDLAKEKELTVGDTFKIRGRDFKVVGILEKMLTSPDKQAIVPLSQAREMFIASQPMLKSFNPADIITGAAVSWDDGVNPERLAKAIATRFPDVSVMAPKEMEKQLNQAMLMFNLIVTGSALIALVVGGLSVINTMTMAVSERTKEIGLKKALGASTRDILKEFITEAGTIGFIGGLIGIGIGGAFVWVVNAEMASRGADIFLMTPRLIGISLAFALCLGAISGIYPAFRAANLDCVRALREE